MLRKLIAFVSVAAFVPLSYAEMEEVVVTAQKREQTLQDVPVAVSVVTSSTIDKAQINDILDLQTVVPSLRVTQLQTSGNTNFLIRGFGNGANNAGIEPSVGVFVDGVYRSRSAAALTDLPNLERIEVLRGPQSTLFGKNASAGVINVVTSAADPSGMDGASGSAALTLGRDSEVIIRGDVTVPLSGSVGFGLSGYSITRDGYFANLANGSEINERDRSGLRGELTYYPSDSLSFRLIANVDQIDEKCCGVANLLNGPTGAAVLLVGGNLVPNSPFAYGQHLDFDPTNDIDNRGFSLQIDYDVSDSMQLTSITGSRAMDRFENADVDFTSAALITQNTGETDIESFTQEVRLSGQADSGLNWLLGFFYFDEEVTQITDLDYGPAFRPYADILSGGGVSATEAAVGLPGGTFFAAGQGVRETGKQDDQTLSIFAQADWEISDRAVVTIGVNYTDVEKDISVSQINTDVFSGMDLVLVGFGGAFAALTGLPPTPENIAAVPAAAQAASILSTTECSAAAPPPACNQLLALRPLQFLPPFQAFPNVVEPGTSNDTKTTWTARIAYDATDAVNIYASASTGFKATSWNLSRDSRPTAGALAGIEAAGLAVTNITAGTRLAGPEESRVYEFGIKGFWSRNYINVAIFSQEIDGFQSNIFTGAAFTLANAGRQSTTGIEVDAMWLATDALELKFSGIFLNPEYDSFRESAVGDISGQTPASIHETSISIAGTYYFDLGGISGFARADYLYEDEIQVVDNVPKSVASREVGLLNASLSFSWNDRFELMLWGRNLTDDEFLQSAFPSVAQAGSMSGYPNQPRTYGLTLRTSF